MQKEVASCNIVVSLVICTSSVQHQYINIIIILLILFQLPLGQLTMPPFRRWWCSSPTRPRDNDRCRESQRYDDQSHQNRQRPRSHGFESLPQKKCNVDPANFTQTMMIISTTTTSWKATVISIYIYIYILSCPKTSIGLLAFIKENKQYWTHIIDSFFVRTEALGIYIYSTWQTVHLESDLKKLHI